MDSSCSEAVVLGKEGGGVFKLFWFPCSSEEVSSLLLGAPPPPDPAGLEGNIIMKGLPPIVSGFEGAGGEESGISGAGATVGRTLVRSSRT